MVRLILGFAAAGLWLPVLLYFAAGEYAEFWFVMTALFTIPLTVFVAVPLYYFWRAHITFGRCLLAGFGIGVVGTLAFLAMTHPEAALNGSPALIGAGVLSSVIFWAIAIWQNGALKGTHGRGTGNAAI